MTSDDVAHVGCLPLTPKHPRLDTPMVVCRHSAQAGGPSMNLEPLRLSQPRACQRTVEVPLDGSRVSNSTIPPKCTLNSPIVPWRRRRGFTICSRHPQGLPWRAGGKIAPETSRHTPLHAPPLPLQNMCLAASALSPRYRARSCRSKSQGFKAYTAFDSIPVSLDHHFTMMTPLRRRKTRG